MEIFLSSFITLFVVVDPIGVAAVFASLVRKQKPEASRKIAIQAAIIATLILIAFGLLGNALLAHLHVSVSAFRIAGGLLLFVTAFRMLMGFHDPDQLESEEGSYKDQSNLAIFPLSIPLLAGPGCMTAVMLHMTTIESMMDKTLVIGSVVAVEILALIAMLTANKLVSIFGEAGSSLLARIMGILMAAMAIQFIADGILGLFPSLSGL